MVRRDLRRDLPAVTVMELSSATGETLCRVTETTDENHTAMLICSCNQFQMTKPGDHKFCDHLRIVLEKNKDGWVDRPIPQKIWVPVFQSPGLTMRVTISTLNPHDHMHGVGVRSEINSDSWHLGFIRTGTGRGAIRNLLIDWLVEMTTQDVPACMAPQHIPTKPEERTIRILPAGWFKPDNKQHLTDLADLLLTGHCRSCNEDSGIPDI